jgi:hypothetical protein
MQASLFQGQYRCSIDPQYAPEHSSRQGRFSQDNLAMTWKLKERMAGFLIATQIGF